jgi:Ethylene insensitive 3
MLHKAAPAQIDLYNKENPLGSNLAQDNDSKSTTGLLTELYGATLVSIMSLLMQHCDTPPQRMFPRGKELPPPWWPTAQEGWSGQRGISADGRLPPFKKPHDLRKK